MKIKSVPLTRVDRVILSSYANVIDSLSDYLGEGYEIVLHSLEDFDKSVVKIVNGFHTGRKEGSPITDLALSMLSRIQEKGDDATSITYFSTNKKGEPLKSATICIRGDKNRVIGLLCINLYLNTSIATVLRSLVPAAENNAGQHRSENFVQSADDLIFDAISEVRTAVFADPSIAASFKHKEIIRRLNDRGIFHLKDGVLKAAEMLNISKNTVYLHLRNIAKEA